MTKGNKGVLRRRKIIKKGTQRWEKRTAWQKKRLNRIETVCQKGTGRKGYDVRPRAPQGKSLVVLRIDTIGKKEKNRAQRGKSEGGRAPTESNGIEKDDDMNEINTEN